MNILFLAFDDMETGCLMSQAGSAVIPLLYRCERSLVGFNFCYSANVLYVADKGVNKTTVYIALAP